MKQIIILLALIISISAVSAECITPQNQMQITKSTELCAGSYSLPEGLIVKADNITLDCKKAELKGIYSGKGITILGNNNIIKNCIIKDYEDALYLSSSNLNTITENTISSKGTALKLVNSYENIIKNNEAEEESEMTGGLISAFNSKFNTFIFHGKTLKENPYCDSNICDTEEEINPCIDNDNYCSINCNKDSDNDCKTEDKPEEENKTTEQTTIPEQQNNSKPQQEPKETSPSIREILKKQLEKTTEEDIDKIIDEILKNTPPNENIEIKREFIVTENKTKIILDIIPKKELENAEIYEFIPKCFSMYLKDIEFSDSKFEIIEEDPLIVWHFSELEAVKTLEYETKKEISENCKELFMAFGLSEEKKQKNKFSILKGLLITLIIIIAVIGLSRVFKK